MKIVYFTHSLSSCWNHGNAHFLRGILREFTRRGDEVIAFEPRTSWSLDNLLADAGDAGLGAFRAAYPDLAPRRYDGEEQWEAELDGADLVIVHEWNEPELVSRLGSIRRSGGRFVLLFHDTHHRVVSDPSAMRAYDLGSYDGVLSFGEALTQVYRQWGWGNRAWTWHEAADTSLFHPLAEEGERSGLVWIGNWGDGERGTELETFLLGPAQATSTPLDVYGVRYPKEARDIVARYGANLRGWLPNAMAPQVFSRHLATVHVPRRFYVEMLPGIPTIRVFEALACGIPLVSAPWSDTEGLFRPGQDFLIARDGEEMARHIRHLRDDKELRQALVASGLESIRSRHSCAHRADELMGMFAGIRGNAKVEPAA